MLDEGFAHILATDAHDVSRRPPNLKQGRELAATRVGEAEAHQLVVTRPRGVLANAAPSTLKMPLPTGAEGVAREPSTAVNPGTDAVGKEPAKKRPTFARIGNFLRVWGDERGS